MQVLIRDCPVHEMEIRSEEPRPIIKVGRDLIVIPIQMKVPHEPRHDKIMVTGHFSRFLYYCIFWNKQRLERPPYRLPVALRQCDDAGNVFEKRCVIKFHGCLNLERLLPHPLNEKCICKINTFPWSAVASIPPDFISKFLHIPPAFAYPIFELQSFMKKRYS